MRRFFHHDNRMREADEFQNVTPYSPSKAERDRRVANLAMEVSMMLGVNLVQEKRRMGKVGEHRRRPIRCTTTGQEWPSIVHAAKELDMTPEGIRWAVRDNRPLRSGLRFEFIGKRVA